MGVDYELRRSDRKTLGLEVSRDGTVIVRAPRFIPRAAIDLFVAKHEAWIRAASDRQARRQAAHPEPTEEQRKAMIARAKAELPPRVAYYAGRMGVRPGRITITSARTRFGSCSPKNDLSFSWRLMDYPQEAIDYVVVHELAHIRHHNHSRAFYDCVAAVMPDHARRRALLRK